MVEQFKDVQGFNGKYLVSNLGNVKSLLRDIILKPDTQNKMGYKRVTLSKSGNTLKYSIHRLVAESFIPNPGNKPNVNHIDNNPSNNHVDNLEWCTHSENMTHAHRQDRLANIKASNAAIEVNKSRHAHLYEERLGDRFIEYFPASTLDQTGRKKKSGSAVAYICQSCSQPRVGNVDWKELREENGLCPNCQNKVYFLEEDIV